MADSASGNEDSQDAALRRVRAGDAQAATRSLLAVTSPHSPGSQVRRWTPGEPPSRARWTSVSQVIARFSSGPPRQYRAGDARAVAEVARDDDRRTRCQVKATASSGAVSPYRARQRRVRRRRPVGGRRRDQGSGGAGPLAERAGPRELLEEAQRRFSVEELSLLERREQGREWTEIAAELGASPEAIRKRLARAIDRVAHELQIDQPDS